MDMAKPIIRFKGYQDDWEQRKFADFTWDAGKRNKEDLDLEPYAITNEHGFIRQRDAHDDFGYMKDTDRKAYNIVQPNSFAYNPARINVGSIGYYKGVENVIVSSLYEVFQTDNYVNDRFLWHWLKSDEFPRWIEKLQEGSVRLYFYYDKLCECQLYMPSLEEQEKIASFLDGIDNLITLHQRKCDETKKLKKYMLQKMFPQNGEKVPEIRFSGFTDDWEQRKFADFTWDAGKRNKEDLDLEPYAITNEHGFIRQRDAHDDFGYMKDTDRKAYNIVQPNSFAYNPARINVGSIGYYKGVENVIVSSLYEVFQTDNYVNDRFLWHWLKSDEFPRWIEKLQEGSVRLYFYYDKLCECQLYMPSLEEQEKIASFLDGIDNLITLHQRKCDETKKLKKYMLQKMFPQNGEKVPEIRFSGFTDDWEQRKLEDYLEVSNEKNRNELLGKEDVLSVSGEFGIVNQIEFQGRSFAGASVANYGVVEVGDIVYTKSPLKSNPYGIIKTNKGKTGIVSTLYAVYKPKKDVDSEFVQIYFELDSRMNLYMHPLVNKGAKNDMKVSDANALKGSVAFPKIEEQIAISQYFNSLDHLITLHQRELENLQNIKKFMLEKMFV